MRFIHRAAIILRIPKKVIGTLCFCFALCWIPGKAAGTTVTLPLTIDYPLLEALVVKKAFTDVDGSAVLLNENNGCRRIVVGQPKFGQTDGRFWLESRVFIRTGLKLGGLCILPVEWTGYIRLFQRPYITNDWVLRFETLDSEVYDGRHRSAVFAGWVWDMIKSHVYDYMATITVDLSPPVTDLKNALPPFFPAALKERIDRMTAGMRPAEVTADASAVRVAILAEVEQTDIPQAIPASAILSEQERRDFAEKWEAWDEFLVQVMLALPEARLAPPDRQLLLDVLLEIRHRFVDAFLSGNRSDPAGEFVRMQFVQAWKRLAPLCRRKLSEDPHRSLLSYLAFFTVADALVVFDRVVPQLEIEISRNGLANLVRLAHEGKTVSLVYGRESNPRLRQILGLGLSMQTSDWPAAGGEKAYHRVKRLPRIAQMALDWLCKTALAQETIDFKDLMPWVFDRQNINSYISRIRQLLTETIGAVVADGRVPENFVDWYGPTVMATAWQESCFRQFEKKKGQVAYLISYNHTSVGLMQINERVWRGIYDVQRLRWDIRYNARVGCQILELYLMRYAVKKIEKMAGKDKPDAETVARLLYAMYNGGPRQFDKFLNRHQAGRYYQSDTLFFEKLNWVQEAGWEKVRICLVGG